MVTRTVGLGAEIDVGIAAVFVRAERMLSTSEIRGARVDSASFMDEETSVICPILRAGFDSLPYICKAASGSAIVDFKSD